MPGGRPSKITDVVTLPPIEGIGPERRMPITEAICLLLEMGSYPTNAAKACGLSENTFANWLRWGAEWADADPEDVPPERRPHVQFLSSAMIAEARGLVWHEQNVRLAGTDRNRDGRLSLEFLARRQPNVYSKRLEVQTDPTLRSPATIDAALAEAAEDSFLASALPPGVTREDFLPALPAAEEVTDAEVVP